MSSEIRSFSASQQHCFQRQQWLQVDGVTHSREQLQQLTATAADPAVVPAVASEQPGVIQQPQADPLTRLRALILASLTGRAIVLDQAEITADHAAAGAARTPASIPATSSAEAVAPAPPEPAPATDVLAEALDGRRLTLLTREREQSQVSLAVSLTLDDRLISGGFSVSLSRRDEWLQSVDLAGVRTFLDPLVLNFNGPLALSTVRTDFDLNADRKADAIARFASDSYALVRDLNGNGRIDDGAEVIGALSGNGFAELQALDDDGNGLITAQDAVWHTLRLWQPGDLGAGLSLAARQVQAVGLAAVSSPFTLRAGAELLGQVRSSGFFVAADAIKLAQQVDLAV